MKWIILLIACTLPLLVSSKQLVVATYNLWNVVFHWDIRKLYISEMISHVHADIVGFQDVRANSDQTHSQLDDLQVLLPEYKHKFFQPVKYMYHEKGENSIGWKVEGVGFLSKHPILSNSLMNFTTVDVNSTSTGSRMLIHVQFDVKDVELNVVMILLSYDRIQQCQDAAEILKYLYGAGVENTILMGDFNTYEHFTWPMGALLKGQFQNSTPSDCKWYGHHFSDERYRGYGYSFVDAWSHINPRNPGLTYSNLAVPGLISRPDRILVSKVGLKVNSVLLIGKGVYYANKYSNDLWWARLKAVYNARDCTGDCGPHASCRCGICARGGVSRQCRPGNCWECSSYSLFFFHLLLLLLVPCAVYYLLLLLICIRKIIKPRFFLSRNNWLAPIICNKHVIIWVTVWTFVLLKGVHELVKGALSLVNNQPREELAPSDHLMVVARVQMYS